MNPRHLLLTTAAAITMLMAACGKQDAPAAAPTPAAPATTPAPAAPADTAATARLEQGKSAYNKTCAMCHAAGVSGAPKPGDKADWDARMAQGAEVVYKHAVEGFTGQKGMMPAKGGNTALSDDDVKAAVDYMVSK